MKDKTFYTAVLAALPALMLAAAGWLEADAQRGKKLDLADNYRAYIEQQMTSSDELEKALRICVEGYRELASVRGCPPCEECPPCASLNPADYPIAASPGPPENEP
jgi:hypothetical protein